MQGIYLLLTLLLFTQEIYASETGNPREKLNFNSGWLVNVGDVSGAEAEVFADGGWKSVALPHAWNEDSAFNVKSYDLPTGVAWYRKHFKLPAGSSGKKVFLEFEGIRQGGDFYLNGKLIGTSCNGVMAFGFDITDSVKPAPQENVIAARIDNSWDYREKETNTPFQWNFKAFNPSYGGINKNVFLHLTDSLHQTLPLYSNLGTTGVYVYAKNINISERSAQITAESQVRNNATETKTFIYEVSIRDMDGKLLQTISGGQHTIGAGETKVVGARWTLKKLNFWSWGYGYLYDVFTTLKVNGQEVDTVNTRTGFRKTEFNNGYVRLNDRAIHLKGYAQRSSNEWPAVGSSVPPWMSDFSNSLMVLSNANLVRWMHVTPWKQDVESCDRVGLMQAMPAGDAEADIQGTCWEQRVRLMRDAIIYNRNNPSIIFYEVGNKGVSEEHMAEMKRLRDQYDPNGGRAIGCREMLESQAAEFGGEMLYINKSRSKPLWAMEYSRDEACRKYWDNWTLPYHGDGFGADLAPGISGAPYNRNQDSFAIEEVTRWYEYWRERPGTGERVNAGGVKIIFSDSNSHSRGSQNYRNSGAVDAMRLPKDHFYAQQVMWDGWVDVERPRAYIVGHWNYETRVRKPIYVVSSAPRVQLFINNKSKGYGEQRSHFLYTWKNVQFEPGTIKAVGYDNKGKQICETQKTTAGEPVSIKLTVHTGANGWKADGADMALVDVEVVDAQGNRCPTAMNLVKFSLQGPAEWRGGVAIGENNHILCKELPVECGINRVILRSRPQAGNVVLYATSDGLKPAHVELASTAFPTSNGISSILPDNGVTARLDRGPTPAGDSMIPTRKNVRIASATAGINEAEAKLAFDDNEMTSWKSDGELQTGWFQVELERPAMVHEIDLKLGGWRCKSYPIRITVDGKEVYTGNTPRSLGYITLPLKPMKGKTVRLELIGAVEDNDPFLITELTDKKPNPKNLSMPNLFEIVEMEVYEPAKF